MKYRFGFDALVLWSLASTGVDPTPLIDEDKDGKFLDLSSVAYVQAVLAGSQPREAASGESEEEAPA